MNSSEVLNTHKKEMGFMPPGMILAGKLGEDFKEIIGGYHYEIWEKENVIPLKYRYFMAIATAVFDGNKKRAILETKKAIKVGATKEELLEVLKQQIWMNGAPTLVTVAPILELIERKL